MDVNRIPSYPDFSRFGKLSKNKVTQFILRQQPFAANERNMFKTSFKTLKVIGSVGEPH
jgi:hypothetical protein